jgi:hypothetical protein
VPPCIDPAINQIVQHRHRKGNGVAEKPANGSIVHRKAMLKYPNYREVTDVDWIGQLTESAVYSLALLWQIYSRRCFPLICLLQYGHR